jgi:hypothetical protein
MTWSLSFSPLLPLPLLAGMAGLALAVVIAGIVRGLRGGWLRALAALALLLALANPVLLNEDRQPLPTVVALVVDKSASQTLDGRDKTTAAAATALKAELGAFHGVSVRTVEAGGANGGAPVDGTQLFGPLATALADVPAEQIGGVIMLTDGQVHDIPKNAAELPKAPIHALISGHEGERDRRIVIDQAPRFGIVGEKQTIRFRVIDDGVANETAGVKVTITRDGDPLATETVTPGTPSELTVDVPHGGLNLIEFEADPMPGELTEINNRAAVEIEGIRENLRVLLVSGEPHPGERSWRNLLKSDASVDLVHFTILRPPEKQDGTPINELSLIAFPTRELFSEKISQFDLIIFDRYAQEGVLPLLYFDNITQYVRDGGALLVASGPDYAGGDSLYDTPLSPVLPAAPTGQTIEQPYYPQVTDAGNRHPVTRGLEGGDSSPPRWGRFFRLIDVDKPDGTVVMKGIDDKPLIVLKREDKGRVAQILSDETWLWARGYEGGGPQVDLFRRLAHWLMKEPDLEEEALRARAGPAGLTIERQTMADTTGPVTVIKPSGARETVALTAAEPGLWRATVAADEIGLWRVEQDDKHAFAHVGAANPLEFVDARSTEAKLAPLAKETGGYIGRMAGAAGDLKLPRIVPVRGGGATAGSDWLGIRMTDASVLKGITRIPLFSGFLALFGVSGLFGLLALLGLPLATWTREGR